MKVSDAVLGALIALLGAVTLWHVRSFPPIPGQNFGAALFPGVVAAGLLLCGLLLAARGVITMAHGGGRAVSFDPWVRNPLTVLRFVSVPAGLLFYVLASGVLGFHVAAGLAMVAWLLLFGVRPLPAVAMAIGFPVLMHLAFYKLLRVPLPWGVLEGIVFP